MDLCGYATLVVIHCLVSIIKNDRITFGTKSEILTVEIKDGMYYMVFPSRMPKVSTLPDIIEKSLNI